jgi:hypothetical protein
MKAFLRAIGLLLLSFYFFPSQAQNPSDTHDAGLWITAGILPKPIAGKWKTLYLLEYRRKENLQETDLFSGTFNLHYILNPHLLLGLGYEFFLNKGSQGGFTPEHRYYPEAVLSYRIQRFSTSFRSRLMNTFTQWSQPYFEHRNRLKLSYSLPKAIPVKPFAYVEPYHEMPNYRFRKVRYAAGCTYAINRHQWDVYYMQEDYHTRPFTRHVIAIDYSYSL